MAEAGNATFCDCSIDPFLGRPGCQRLLDEQPAHVRAQRSKPARYGVFGTWDREELVRIKDGVSGNSIVVGNADEGVARLPVHPEQFGGSKLPIRLSCMAVELGLAVVSGHGVWIPNNKGHASTSLRPLVNKRL